MLYKVWHIIWHSWVPALACLLADMMGLQETLLLADAILSVCVFTLATAARVNLVCYDTKDAIDVWLQMEIFLCVTSHQRNTLLLPY